MTVDESDFTNAVLILKKGGIIAYPTEAVYGLGCDPFNMDAVSHLLQLKQRFISKGFILIAAHWKQIQPLVQPIPQDTLDNVFATWPGPVTWVFPVQPEVPTWIHGEKSTIAVRVTQHPIAAKLCQLFGGPIISTSANITGQTPIKDLDTLLATFPDGIDFIVPGPLGNQTQPSQIRDARTGAILRR